MGTGARRLLDAALSRIETLRDATAAGDARVLLALLGPAVRGFVLERGKRGRDCTMRSGCDVRFDWTYGRDRPDLAALHAKAKRGQWDGATALAWGTPVDPHDEEHDLWPEELSPLAGVPGYRTLPRRSRQLQRHAFMSWVLSQFLHGEQGALYAACQITESVASVDGKLFGSQQVADEGRHVEVFHRYLTEKLGRLYAINDNLYVILDALMTDRRWDLKLLGMQIMIEGLALGAFGTIRQVTREPLLKRMLGYVITDEARHVHFGVLALQGHYANELTERERSEREAWAFEMSLLMRNRFLAHEFYDEFYGHRMGRRSWDRLMHASTIMQMFRRSMFRRIVPNLKWIGLLSVRIRPHYEAIGLLEWEHDKAAPDLSDQELLAGGQETAETADP
jgi:hypothetical protein